MVCFRRKTSGAGSTQLTMVHPDVVVKDTKVIGMQPISVKTLI